MAAKTPHSILREFLKIPLVLAPILLVGTLGYMWLEKLGPLDALYFTIITITTVGFGDIVPIHQGGKIFTIVLICCGVGFVAYMFGRVTEAMVEGGLRNILERTKMNRKVAGLKDHYIVCGFGRIGKVICRILEENGKSFVVIEKDREEILEIEKLGYVELRGEASDDEVLLAAGIERARGLIAVVSTDADNVYITLTARGLNPDLHIIARASETPGVKRKLERAGADRVISPYYFGARRMAQLVVRPTVVDFLDLTMYADDMGLRLEEVRIRPNASIAGMTLMDSGIRKKYDIIVVAIKRSDGTMLFNPRPDTLILAGDVLVLLGEHDHIRRLQAQA